VLKQFQERIVLIHIEVPSAAAEFLRRQSSATRSRPVESLIGM
jgi:hypothetical protein